MAGGKLLTRALSFLSTPLLHFRYLSTATAAAVGNVKPTPESSVSVLHFLRGRGLGDDVIAKFAPRQLESKVGRELPAKFDLLLTLGFSVPEAAKVLRNSTILSTASLIRLRKRLDTLRTIVPNEADLPRIITRAVWTLNGSHIECMVENMSKLRGWGVSDAKIMSFMVSNPRFFQLKPQCVIDNAVRAEAEFGVRRDSKLFLRAVCALCTTNLESRFRIFVSFGWERSGVIALFKAFPNCIALAETTLVKKLGFLMNEAGFDPSAITKYPAVLGYSLEKRVRPRFELVNALKSKNLLPEAHGFYQTWCITETEFMEKYVVKFLGDEPAICNAYINTLATSKQ